LDQIIKSELLSQFPDIVHGISTKLSGYEQPPYYNNLSYYVGDDKEQVKNNRDIFFGRLGIDQQKLAIPQQIHSDNVRIIDQPGYYRDTDALITQNKNIFLIISTADCYSILIHDPETEIIAAVHSGWRGTQKNILTKTINIMLNDLKCRADNMYIFVGPGISKSHFEVGKEVAEMFDKKFVSEIDCKICVDLKAHINKQLNNFKFKSGKIEIFPFCTFEENDYLHSYRRDKERSGRMFSVIGMKR
jgi:YfiH family protein